MTQLKCPHLLPLQYYTPMGLQAFPLDKQSLQIQMEIPEARCVIGVSSYIDFSEYIPYTRFNVLCECIVRFID